MSPDSYDSGAGNIAKPLGLPVLLAVPEGSDDIERWVAVPEAANLMQQVELLR